MKITPDMIDPQLAKGGRLVRAMAGAPAGGDKYAKRSRMSGRFLRLMVGRNVKGLDCSTVWLDRPDGSKLRLRIYRPVGQGNILPGLLWIHGGGYSLGVPELNGSRFKDLIALRPAVIVSPDYRLSVDAPYPAALDDCYLTLKWMKDNAEDLRLQPDQLMVGGESAGGGLTAAVTLAARDRREVNVAYQFPLYPMIDDRDTGSSRDNDAPVWSAVNNRAAWDLYLGQPKGSDGVSKYAAPARETDYSALPPTFTFVGDIEPFRDETISYVENLRAAGVPVDFELYPGAFHGFDGIVPKAAISVAATRRFMDAYATAIDTCRAAQTN